MVKDAAELRFAHQLSQATNEGDAERLRALFSRGVSPDILSPEDEYDDDEDDDDDEDEAPDPLAARVVVAAVHGGSVEVLQAFIDAGVTLDGLLEAATRRFADPTPFIAALVKGGAPLDEPDGDGIPPLIAAAGAPWVATQAVAALLDHGAEINATDAKGRTALHAAISSAGGNLETVQLLLARGIDVDRTDADGVSALAWAEQRRQHDKGQLDEIMASLREHGAAVGSGSADLDSVVDGLRRLQRDSPPRLESLADAARSGDVALVQAFLADGQHPEEPYREGFYPVQVAQRAGHAAIVELLVAAGGQPRTPPPTDPAAEARARRNRQLLAELEAEGSESLRRVENAKERAALEREIAIAIGAGALGVDPPSAKVGNVPILSFAAEQGLVTVVDALLQAGVPVDGTDASEHHPPLVMATRGGHAEVSRRLLAAGANPSLSHDDRIDPLAAASHSGDLGLVEALLEAGAGLDYVGPAGQTAVNRAAGPQRNAIRLALRDARRETSMKAKVPAIVSKRRKKMYDPSSLHGMDAYAGYAPSSWPRWAVRATPDEVCDALASMASVAEVERGLAKTPMLAAHRFAIVFQLQGSAWSHVSEIGTVPTDARQRVVKVAEQLKTTACWYAYQVLSGNTVEVAQAGDAALRPIDPSEVDAWLQQMQLWIAPHHIEGVEGSELGWHNQLRLHGLRADQLVAAHRVVWQR